MTLSAIQLLIVDDETVFRNNLSKLLRIRGIRSAQAENGEACLDFLAKNAIDVVLLDVKMPGLNGIQVLEQIKAGEYTAEVILLTGEASTQDGVAGIKAGAFDYLTKPVEIEHLVTKISQAYHKILLLREQKREAAFRKKVEEKMMTTERLASLGTLAAGVGHEINNPLAIINESAGWIQLLLQKDELKNIPYKNDIENALQKIDKSIDRARHITHQLLGMVRNHDTAFSLVNLTAIAKEAMELVARFADEKRISIRLNTDARDIKITSDPYQLRQILINLLTNAIHAEYESGEIRVSLRKKDPDVILAVQDNGPGIPEENRGKIFDPFFTTKKPGEGTGLGLFVTRRIVEQLQGHMDFQSKVGRGTTFFVSLPVRPLGFDDQIGAADN